MRLDCSRRYSGAWLLEPACTGRSWADHEAPQNTAIIPVRFVVLKASCWMRLGSWFFVAEQTA
jgi:hypothetical protein